MIDFDADDARATRLTFRGGWCANSKGPDCHVPLAFNADDALWHDTAVAIASANQTAAAAAALKAFVRCTIPADRLLWLNWQMPPVNAVGAARFRARPVTADARRLLPPEPHREQPKASCWPGFVPGCDGVCHGATARGRVPRSLSYAGPTALL